VKINGFLLSADKCAIDESGLSRQMRGMRELIQRSEALGP